MEDKDSFNIIWFILICVVSLSAHLCIIFDNSYYSLLQISIIGLTLWFIWIISTSIIELRKVKSHFQIKSFSKIILPITIILILSFFFRFFYLSVILLGSSFFFNIACIILFCGICVVSGIFRIIKFWKNRVNKSVKLEKITKISGHKEVYLATLIPLLLFLLNPTLISIIAVGILGVCYDELKKKNIINTKIKTGLVGSLFLFASSPWFSSNYMNNHNFESKISFQNVDHSIIDPELKQTCLKWQFPPKIYINSYDYQRRISTEPYRNGHNFEELCKIYQNFIQIDKSQFHFSIIEKEEFVFTLNSTPIQENTTIIFQYHMGKINCSVLDHSNNTIYLKNFLQGAWMNTGYFNSTLDTDEFEYIIVNSSFQFTKPIFFVNIQINYYHHTNFKAHGLYINVQMVIDEDYNVVFVIVEDWD